MSTTQTDTATAGEQFADTAMHRQLFTEMSAQQQEAFIAGMQERRLASLRRYEEAKAIKLQARNDKLSAQAVKKAAQIDKLLDKCAEQLDKIDAEVTKYRALQLLMHAEDAAEDISETQEEEDNG